MYEWRSGERKLNRYASSCRNSCDVDGGDNNSQGDSAVVEVRDGIRATAAQLCQKVRWCQSSAPVSRSHEDSITSLCRSFVHSNFAIEMDIVILGAANSDNHLIRIGRRVLFGEADQISTPAITATLREIRMKGRVPTKLPRFGTIEAHVWTSDLCVGVSLSERRRMV